MTLEHPSAAQLQELLDGVLSAADDAALREHIEHCVDTCLPRLDELRRASRTAPLFDRRRRERGNRGPSPGGASRAADQTTSSFEGAPPATTLALVTELLWRRSIGRGGQGEVHLFEDATLGRKVAVKFAAAAGDEFADDSLREEARRRFARECLVTSRLEHPGVAPVYAVGRLANFSDADDSDATQDTPTDPGQPLCAMRFYEGTTLAVEIERYHGRANPARNREADDFVRLLRSFQTVCRTIQYAHDRGIAHCDLKPQNVVLQQDAAIVVDWGNAQFLDDRRPDSDERSTLVGTPSYLPPEVAAGNRSEDRRPADVFGLGAILFHILTGTPPHRQRRDETLAQLVARIARETVATPLERLRELPAPSTPQTLAEDADSPIPAELDSICRKATQFDPIQRYRRPGDLADEVENWLLGRTVQAHSYTASERARRWTDRHANHLAAGLALMAVVALVAAAAAMRVNDARRQERRMRLTAQAEGRRADERSAEAREAQRIAELNAERADAYRRQLSIDSARRSLIAGDLSRAKQDAGSLGDSWEARYLQRLAETPLRARRTFSTATWGILDADLDASQRRLVVADAAGQVTLWDLDAERVIHQWGAPRWDPTRRRPEHLGLAIVNQDSATGAPRCDVAVRWLGDSDAFVSASLDGRGRRIDARTGNEQGLLEADAALITVATNGTRGVVLFGDVTGVLHRVELASRSRSARSVGDAPLTEIQWDEQANAWLVGDEHGRMLALRDGDLSERQAWTYPGPIWSIARAERGHSARLAVAAGDGVLRVLERPAPDADWNAIATLPSETNGRESTPQRVAFVEGGAGLLAFRSDLTLSLWDVDARLHRWTAPAGLIDARRAVATREHVSRESSPILFPFRRLGAALLPLANDRQWITAGDDAVATQWEVTRAEPAWSRRVVASLGPAPSLAFDQRDSILWTLDAFGELAVISLAEGQRLASLPRAHRGGRAAIASLPRGGVVTVGNDEEARRWRWNKGVIELDGSELKHDAALLSVATDDPSELGAAVDARSRLVVWRRDTGAKLLVESIDPASSDEPWTGKVAFNHDSTMLAAFGPGQSNAVYRIERESWRIERIADALWVAGRHGGTALVWNPAVPSAIISADDALRLHSRDFGAQAGGRERNFPSIDREVVALARSAAGEPPRVFSLDAAGYVAVYDGKWGLRMLETATGLTAAVDLAVDPRGRWLAASGRDGELELLDAGLRSEALPLPGAVEPSSWTTQEVLAPSESTRRFDLRSMRLDDQDRLCFLLLESTPSDFRDEGELWFARETAQGFEREALRPPREEHARRMSMMAACWTLSPQGEPLVAHRCRNAEVGAYQGTVYFRRRLADGRWETEPISAGGNEGFFPVLIPGATGESVDLLHFSYDGFGLRHSRRDASGRWTTSRIGHQGDGLFLDARQDEAGRVHLLFRVNRFNGDRVAGGRIVWSPLDGVLEREVLSGEPLAEFRLALTAQQEVAVVRLRYRPDSDTFEPYVAIRGKENWRIAQKLPEVTRFAWRFGPDHATYIVAWSPPTRSLVLLRGVGDAWTRQHIARIDDAGPQEVALFFDRQGQPVVFVAGPLGPLRWARVYRRSSVAPAAE